MQNVLRVLLKFGHRSAVLRCMGSLVNLTLETDRIPTALADAMITAGGVDVTSIHNYGNVDGSPMDCSYSIAMTSDLEAGDILEKVIEAISDAYVCDVTISRFDRERALVLQ